VLTRLVFRPVGLFVLSVGSLPLIAQDFSAKLVRLKPANSVTTKVYAHGPKMRFEATGGQRSSVAIIDLQSRTTLMIVPDNQTYIKTTHVNSSLPLFQIADVENACPAWQKSLDKPETCTKVGDEAINNREAVKYKGTARDGDTGYAWVDRRLKTVIRWEGERSAAELQDIQEGPQDTSLFQVPDGYQMFDLAAAQEAARAKQGSKTPPKKKAQ
jgi:hypothetical protein